jgi:hypothetical protein
VLLVGAQNQGWEWCPTYGSTAPEDLEARARGFNLPHYHSDHPTEDGSCPWHDIGSCSIAARGGGHRHHGSKDCRGGSLRPWGLHPLWAQDGPRPPSFGERDLLTVPRKAPEAKMQSLGLLASSAL